MYNIGPRLIKEGSCAFLCESAGIKVVKGGGGGLMFGCQTLTLAVSWFFLFFSEARVWAPGCPYAVPHFALGGPP